MASASGITKTIHDEMHAPKEICVLGAGAFGTAMAWCAARNGHRVRWFARDAVQVKQINETHRNPKYLSEFELPDNIVATTDAAEALRGCDLVILALPAQKTPDWIREHRDAIPADVVFCSTAKGLYLPGKQLLSEAMLAAFARPQRLAFLSGPSFARQILEGHPTAVVVASALLADAVTVQFALSGLRFRVYASQDTVGVELGGALKNPLALGAGMIEGRGYGINTMAAYVTRAARELSILSIAHGGKPETIAGLAGVGDLMLTAFGELSRNRNCGKHQSPPLETGTRRRATDVARRRTKTLAGLRLARGEKLEDILGTATVEGVPTAQVAVEFAARCNLDLPLFTIIHGILSNEIEVDEALELIMKRPLGTEIPINP
ncbi:NAD-dependent glycerol-3-phosphate dehydrogenase [Pelagophyceae sp. CCMP2097]|nr:NAD-dependent glycerol-3-phosphate dehydrogenase [Pelagophyceae sp. CCMP2097]